MEAFIRFPFFYWHRINMLNFLDYFSSLVQEDDTIPLFEAALTIAQDAYPKLDLAAVHAEVDTLASKLQQRLPSDYSTVQKLRMLNHFFYRELGFACNTNNYYDPDNSYLHQVIHKRRGIPISLAVVYIELAHNIGLNIKGVAFPGHFLMKLSVQSGDIIIDPINGASLSREVLEERLTPYFGNQEYSTEIPLTTYLQAVSARTILARMLHNLKSIFLENQDWSRLMGVSERLVMLLPDDIIERRDRGLAYANLECPLAALQDLEAYLADRPYASDAPALHEKVAQLREACKRLN